MSFEENDWKIDYYVDKPPGISHSGVNVESECRDGVISIRKAPTGILLHSEKCLSNKAPICTVCIFNVEKWFNVEPAAHRKFIEGIIHSPDMSHENWKGHKK